MDDNFLILSDIHGNVSAFDSVIEDCKNENFSGIILLGDLIDYGMRSNEIIQKISLLSESVWKDKIIVNIWGNHERLIIYKDLDRLSYNRGRVMAEYTARQLNDYSVQYIKNVMNNDGYQEFSICGFDFLAVHGSLEDVFWKAIEPQNLRGDYSQYDIVFSGHSHYSQAFSYFYPVDNKEMRNKKAVLFINPGSVGQPRNQNPNAQYAVLTLPSKTIELRAVKYDIKYEQSLYPDDIIDPFYKNRLTRGV